MISFVMSMLYFIQMLLNFWFWLPNKGEGGSKVGHFLQTSSIDDPLDGRCWKW
jgi:hypothetical protein